MYYYLLKIPIIYIIFVKISQILKVHAGVEGEDHKAHLAVFLILYVFLLMTTIIM